MSIIRSGRTVESGTLADMRHLTRTSISVETKKPPTGIGDLQGIHGLKLNGTRAEFDVDTNRIDPVLELLTGFGVRSLDSHPPTLEELFLRQYGDEPKQPDPGVEAS